MKAISLLVGVGALVGGIYAVGYMQGKKKQGKSVVCEHKYDSDSRNDCSYSEDCTDDYCYGRDRGCADCIDSECINYPKFNIFDEDEDFYDSTDDEVSDKFHNIFVKLWTRYNEAIDALVSKKDAVTPTQCDSRERDESICDRCDCRDLCGVHCKSTNAAESVDDEFEECLEEVELEDKVFKNVDDSPAKFDDELPIDEECEEEVKELVQDAVTSIKSTVDELKGTTKSIVETTKMIADALGAATVEEVKKAKSNSNKKSKSTKSTEKSDVTEKTDDTKVNEDDYFESK